MTTPPLCRESHGILLFCQLTVLLYDTFILNILYKLMNNIIVSVKSIQKICDRLLYKDYAYFTNFILQEKRLLPDKREMHGNYIRGQ